jgi:hypothetical protein
LERSVDDLESTVCALEERLESKVGEINAVSIAKNEQEGTEANSKLYSFGGNVSTVESQKRMHAAIRVARNYRNPRRDYSWVSSLG